MVFELSHIVMLFPVVVLAYAANAGIGVGAALVAVTLGSNVLPVRDLIPVILPLSIITTGYLAFRERQHIAVNLLVRRILPAMGVGLLIGVACLSPLGSINLKAPLGIAVMILSGWQLISLFAAHRTSKPMTTLKFRLFLVLAGIVHAVYTTGGPLLAYSVSRSDLSKAVFRATMCMVLVSTNSALALAFFWADRFSIEMIKISAPLVLALPIGIYAGEWFYHRFSEKVFKIVTYTILIGSGISLVISSLQI